jgi:hypothetical protein
MGELWLAPRHNTANYTIHLHQLLSAVTVLLYIYYHYSRERERGWNVERDRERVTPPLSSKRPPLALRLEGGGVGEGGGEEVCPHTASALHPLSAVCCPDAARGGGWSIDFFEILLSLKINFWFRRVGGYLAIMDALSLDSIQVCQ